MQVREIGHYLFPSFGEPLSNIGVIIAVFHIAGILDVNIEILNMHDIGYEISLTTFFKRRPENLSGPGLPFDFSLLMIFLTFSGVKQTEFNLFPYSLISSPLGRILLSAVKSLEKLMFSNLAFSKSSY